MAVFTNNGYIKQSLHRHDSPDRGTGVWGSEINRGTLAYIESLKINPKYERQGVGRWAIESLLRSDVLAVSSNSSLGFQQVMMCLTLEFSVLKKKALSLFFHLGHDDQ